MTVQQVTLHLRAAFWVLPASCALAAGILAPLIARIDAALGGSAGVLYAGGPESARQMLAVIASSVLTFAGLAFSITIVALQLASSQFSPRVLRSMLRDRWTQTALGVFVGTFVFSLLTLREIRTGDTPDTGFVPGLAVSVSLVLALASIAALMGFIHHMAQSLRVVTIIEKITAETVRSLDQWYGDVPRSRRTAPIAPAADGARRVLASPHTGVLTWYDDDGLTSVAVEHDSTVELLVAPGTYVISGQPLLRVTGADLDVDALLPHLTFGSERETGTDPAYGFRQLVDIAERALSPGVNDPTTAVQCIDRLHGLLRRIATRDLAVGHRIVDGVLRLRMPDASWADYVALACDEIRHWGADSPRVCRRLDAMLQDLLALVDDDRADVVARQLQLLTARRRASLPDGEWGAALGPGDPSERPAVARLES